MAGWTKAYFRYLWWFGLGLLVLFGFGIVGGFIGTGVKLFTTPTRVISRTLDTDNVIRRYEWFHDVSQKQRARVQQIIQFKGFVAGERDPAEKRRLRMEMAAQEMSCRDLVAKYNANSEKLNVGIFRGWSLPESLDISTCE